MLSILILEDDVTFSLMLTTWLEKKGFLITTTSSVSKAKANVVQAKYDLILSDFRLPDGNGLDFLIWLKQQNVHLPFIIMTSYADIPTAVKAIKAGAADYITKPLNPEELLIKIDELTNKHKVEQKKDKVSKNPAENACLEGKSQAAIQLFEHVKLVAPTDMAVLITGASGTGKEFIAKRIHQQSKRSAKPFVSIDCGALSKELAASEFFGHIKGAFTGANTDKEGAFVAANKGTIFLDEIGNLSYDVQVQLLRALQEKEIKPIGSNSILRIDVRLITATNENLQKAIVNGSFREDLYHRVNEFSIAIPSLKERKEDLFLFANHFLDLANNELGKNIVGFDPECIRLFQSYSWPGNLRQMKNAVRYATLLTTGSYITVNDLPKELFEIEDAFQGSMTLKDEGNERLLIEKALVEAKNNKTKAAQLLGIDRKTLYNKLKIYKIY